MNSIRRRYPGLSPASPHKLRHTGATLARRAGISLEEISEALTHSDKQVTKTYVNTTDTVNQTVGEIAFRNLKKWLREISGNLLFFSQKRHPR
ncbi:putative phage integrase family protein [Streptococcus intermedius C270]|nr:putative phage integrase family protein [Streptococcus intermedius C270]